MTFADILHSPVVVTIVVAAALYTLNWLFTKQPALKKFEGAIISGIRFAEKQIPDGTQNGGLSKLDFALQYVIKIYEQAKNKKVTQKDTDEMKEAIIVAHDKMKTDGSI